jgi:putative phosphoribosyl transferase
VNAVPKARDRTFVSRVAAGEALARAVADGYAGEPAAVLALPRGGVPTAVPVARELHAPLDVILVRKVGAAGNPELGIGAVAEGGVRSLDGTLIRHLRMEPGEVDHSLSIAEHELAAQIDEYRSGHHAAELSGRTAVIVDDGLATGSTAVAAVHAARSRGAAKVVVAVPVASREAVLRLSSEAEDVVALQVPDRFNAVGGWYADFSPVPAAEVHALLAESARLRPAGPRTSAVEIPVGSGIAIAGDLTVPETATGLVVFAHGSGSSRMSTRNRQVAQRLQQGRLGTLLVDLLTVDEETDRRNVFDIGLLGARVKTAVEWCSGNPVTAGLAVGLFGASTGAGAALVAAAADERVRAVVSRGGRPDLAGSALMTVRVPVLLIVGGNDLEVLELNREAQGMLAGTSELAVVPRAGHLFEEAGALERVGDLAADWFSRHLVA